MRRLLCWAWALGAVARASAGVEEPAAGDPAQLFGTWRGTSVCADRVAAPACQDEVVVYEFTAGPKPGIVRWAADKVVDGKRVPMGELELSFDKGKAAGRPSSARRG